MRFAVVNAIDEGGESYARRARLEAYKALSRHLRGRVLSFAMRIVRSGVLGPRLTWVVVTAAARFVPLGSALYLGGVAGIVALWPLAYEMWKHSEAVRPAGQPRPMLAT